MFPTFNMKIFTLNFILEFILSIIEQKNTIRFKYKSNTISNFNCLQSDAKKRVAGTVKGHRLINSIEKSYVNINTWIDGY